MRIKALTFCKLLLGKALPEPFLSLACKNHSPTSPHVYVDYRFLMVCLLHMPRKNLAIQGLMCQYTTRTPWVNRRKLDGILSCFHMKLWAPCTLPHVDLLSRLIGDPGVSRWRNSFAWKIQMSQKGTIRPIELGYSISLKKRIHVYMFIYIYT